MTDLGDVAAIVGPLTTLLAGLGGLWLGERAAARREVRTARRETYRKVLRHVATLANRANEANRADDPNRYFETWLTELNELRADLALDGSALVQEKYEAVMKKLNSPEYVEAVEEGHRANQAQIAERVRAAREANAGGRKTPTFPSIPLIVAYEKAIRPVVKRERDALAEAMRKDIGNNKRAAWWRGWPRIARGK
jgi:hypothetical protein